MDKFKKYRDAVDDGITEVGKLSKQKKLIDAEISKLLNLIAANIAMLPASERQAFAIELEAVQVPSGLRDAVIRGLSYTEFRSATEVREEITKSGFDLSGQANPLASVSTTLRRLVDDKIANSKEQDGRTVYKRGGIMPRPVKRDTQRFEGRD